MSQGDPTPTPPSPDSSRETVGPDTPPTVSGPPLPDAAPAAAGTSEPAQRKARKPRQRKPPPEAAASEDATPEDAKLKDVTSEGATSGDADPAAPTDGKGVEKRSARRKKRSAGAKDQPPAATRETPASEPKPKAKTKSMPKRRRAKPVARNTSERSLIIRRLEDSVEIALLEQGRLVELHQERLDSKVSVGDIFLGKVRKLNPGMNAAFVDIGAERDGFLIYHDLGPQLRSMIKFVNGAVNGTFKTAKLDRFKPEADIDKGGQVGQVLKPKQQLLFQVSKEPISTKGPRLEAVVNLPGRYVVLSPFGKGVNVSKKIGAGEERQRLKELVRSLVPARFGAIVRTAAEGRQAEELIEDIQKIEAQWAEIFGQLHKAKAPVKLLSELDKTSGLLRDLLSDKFNRIVVDDAGMYEDLRAYLESISPESVDLLTLHKGSNVGAFEKYGVARQIKASFGKTVTVPTGAYLVIESTEAMHVVDVNSGNKMAKNREEAIFNVNMIAGRELARQMRLRDMGGLIVVDFIDMRNAEHRQELLAEVRKAMAYDRAQHTVLPLTKFGLMQITRQRVRPEIQLSTAEVCPTCKGTGEVNPTELIIDDIERDLRMLLENVPNRKLSLRTHAFVHAFLTKGLPSLQMRWLWRHQQWVKLEVQDGLGMTEYVFLDEGGEEVMLGEV